MLFILRKEAVPIRHQQMNEKNPKQSGLAKTPIKITHVTKNTFHLVHSEIFALSNSYLNQY